MADFNHTITNQLNAYGSREAYPWDAFNWGEGYWGTDEEFDQLIGHLVSETASATVAQTFDVTHPLDATQDTTVSDSVMKNPNKVLEAGNFTITETSRLFDVNHLVAETVNAAVTLDVQLGRQIDNTATATVGYTFDVNRLLPETTNIGVSYSFDVVHVLPVQTCAVLGFDAPADLTLEPPRARSGDVALTDEAGYRYVYASDEDNLAHIATATSWVLL